MWRYGTWAPNAQRNRLWKWSLQVVEQEEMLANKSGGGGGGVTFSEGVMVKGVVILRYKFQ